MREREKERREPARLQAGYPRESGETARRRTIPPLLRTRCLQQVSAERGGGRLFIYRCCSRRIGKWFFYLKVREVEHVFENFG